MYLNFSQVGGYHMYLYFPVVLIGVSVALLFNPLKMFYFRTRMWLLYSLVSRTVMIRPAATNHLLVAPIACRCLPCRVAGLLPRRHVLLLDIHHGCECYLAPLQDHC
jgi:hypothetical protein